MASPVVLPKQGNTVESCLILRWLKSAGDPVTAGEPLCEVETDKAIVEVPSPGEGVLLETFFQAGEEVPVLTHIAVIGQPGEETDAFRPHTLPEPGSPEPGDSAPAPQPPKEPAPPPASAPADPGSDRLAPPISPRASRLAIQAGIDPTGLQGSGPHGRIIERDVVKAVTARPPLTPLARSMVARGPYVAPAQGSGVRGRVMSRDLLPASPPSVGQVAPRDEPPVTAIPLRGVRRLIAERMLQSVQTSAQLTLHTSADARALLAYRARLKESPPEWGLQAANLNDLLLLVIARILRDHPALNATLEGETIYQHRKVHMGFAVDTPRGLVVPVVREAASLRLEGWVRVTRRLSEAARDGRISPDDLSGGTFTVTNLGNLGIETFTPILNPPQVAILGIGAIQPKPVERPGGVEFFPHLNLSLTINHQAVDGAPAARFLADLTQAIANLDLIMAT